MGNVIPEADLSQLGRRRCSLLSQFTGVEHQPIWEWALIQFVSNGLSLQQMGLADPASVQLAMADAWAASGDLIGPSSIYEETRPLLTRLHEPIETEGRRL
jgi:hypothetical protein